MTDRDEYRKWKQTLERLREKRSKAEGELESYKKELKETFGIIDVEEAQKHLNSLEKAYTDQTTILENMVKAFKDEYGHSEL